MTAMSKVCGLNLHSRCYVKGCPCQCHEKIDHPAHYNVGGIEVIDAIEAWRLGFCLGNAVKYIARADHKGEDIEDLKKARWYLDREIATRESRRGA